MSVQCCAPPHRMQGPSQHERFADEASPRCVATKTSHQHKMQLRRAPDATPQPMPAPQAFVHAGAGGSGQRANAPRRLRSAFPQCSALGPGGPATRWQSMKCPTRSVNDPQRSATGWTSVDLGLPGIVSGCICVFSEEVPSNASSCHKWPQIRSEASRGGTEI